MTPRCKAGDSSVPPDEGSLFHVSPVSPGFLFRPLRATQQLPHDGALLQTMLDEFHISVLGEPITYARCEQIPGSDSPLSLPVYALPSGSALMPVQSMVQTLLASGTSSCRGVGSSTVAPPIDMEDCLLLETGLPGCPYRFAEDSGQPFSDGNPAFWLATSSPAVSGVRRSTGVGSPVVPFADILGGSAWKGTSDSGCRQPAAGRRHNVVQPSSTVTVRHVTTPYVIRNDSLGHRPDGVSSGRGRRFFTGATGGLGGKVHVGHGPVAPSDGSG